jgi:hypothetical protein
MEATAPFLLRRVLLGVVVGLALVVVAFYGWVQLRTSQYHGREHAMLLRYQRAYTLCVTAGSVPSTCAAKVYTACRSDPFWAVGLPFTLDVDSRSSEAALRCRNGATG